MFLEYLIYGDPYNLVKETLQNLPKAGFVTSEFIGGGSEFFLSTFASVTTASVAVAGSQAKKYGHSSEERHLAMIACFCLSLCDALLLHPSNKRGRRFQLGEKLPDRKREKPVIQNT